jgi:AraC-like DNA-binding protein
LKSDKNVLYPQIFKVMMINFYKIVKESLHFNRFEFDNTVCLEYSCPIEADQVGIFSQSDYIVHVLSGKKTYNTINGQWTLTSGQTLFMKKGATIIQQYFDNEFCMLGFFMCDDLITETVSELKGKIPIKLTGQAQEFTATEVQSSSYLEGYFHSMLTYFRAEEQPPNHIIKMKLKELLVNIMNCDPVLNSYLGSFISQDKPSLSGIMEANFRYNLKLEDFAELTHRSLSSFKRDFQNYYNESPGKWLLKKRVDYAANLLLSSEESISQIAFGSGFEDLSHFSRVFKERTGKNPSDFRKVQV